jgi:uncharacterized membrane protein YukC
MNKWNPYHEYCQEWSIFFFFGVGLIVNIVFLIDLRNYNLFLTAY